MEKIIGTLMVCILLFNTSVSFAEDNLSFDDRKLGNNIDSYLKNIEKNQGFQGNVLVARKGNIILKSSYGYGNVEKKILLNPEDKMSIGSITKEFLAMSILQLEEKGLLDTKEKIIKYFPEYKYGEDITIDNLLVHNSGIKDFVDYKQVLFSNEYEKADINYIYNKIINEELRFKPGEKFEYSSSNYFLLSLILEKVTGQSLDSYLIENIFKPLEMTNTGVIKSDMEVLGVDPNPFFINMSEGENNKLLSNVLGAGYMYSTLDDLYKWDRALYTTKLLSQKSLDKMFNGQVIIRDGVKSSYGFRINNGKYYGKRIYHTGESIGYTSNLSRYVDKDTTIILLSNIGEYNIGYFRDSLEKIIFMNQAISGEKESLNEKLLGRYKIGYGMDINLYKVGEDIYCKISGSKAMKVFPVGKNKLRFVNTKVDLEFSEKDGEILGVLLKPYGIRGLKLK